MFLAFFATFYTNMKQIGATYIRASYRYKLTAGFLWISLY